MTSGYPNTIASGSPGIQVAGHLPTPNSDPTTQGNQMARHSHICPAPWAIITQPQSLIHTHPSASLPTPPPTCRGHREQLSSFPSGSQAARIEFVTPPTNSKTWDRGLRETPPPNAGWPSSPEAQTDSWDLMPLTTCQRPPAQRLQLLVGRGAGGRGTQCWELGGGAGRQGLAPFGLPGI